MIYVCVQTSYPTIVMNRFQLFVISESWIDLAFRFPSSPLTFYKETICSDLVFYNHVYV